MKARATHRNKNIAAHDLSSLFQRVSSLGRQCDAPKAGGLLSVFLAAWSLDPRSFADDAAAAGRSAANRIRMSQFTRGNPRVSVERKMVAGVCRRHRYPRKTRPTYPAV